MSNLSGVVSTATPGFSNRNNMDKETLSNRITTLQNEQLQAKNAVAVYEGAIQDCKYWLQQLAGTNEPIEETASETSSE